MLRDTGSLKTPHLSQSFVLPEACVKTPLSPTTSRESGWWCRDWGPYTEGARGEATVPPPPIREQSKGPGWVKGHSGHQKERALGIRGQMSERKQDRPLANMSAVS